MLEDVDRKMYFKELFSLNKTQKVPFLRPPGEKQCTGRKNVLRVSEINPGDQLPATELGRQRS
jgi:hypothetical protein